MERIFVQPDEVAKNHDRIAIVDVRDQGEYREEHVPGAVSVPFDEFRDPTDEIEGKLPTSDDFGSLLGDMGITPDDRIVAYDDEFGVYASRFLVTAEVFGHDFDRMHILDGGYTEWCCNHSTSTQTPSINEVDYICERTDDGPIVSAREMEEALSTDVVIVDTRDPIEYDTVHLPEAVSFQWRDLVDEGEDERGLKPLDVCRRVLASHGITLDRPVRLYCNTARRLSFVYAVLCELGHNNVGFYEGGIDAWADYGGPVETT